MRGVCVLRYEGAQVHLFRCLFVCLLVCCRSEQRSTDWSPSGHELMLSLLLFVYSVCVCVCVCVCECLGARLKEKQKGS